MKIFGFELRINIFEIYECVKNYFFIRLIQLKFKF
jgi:hypothetical protein